MCILNSFSFLFQKRAVGFAISMKEIWISSGVHPATDSIEKPLTKFPTCVFLRLVIRLILTYRCKKKNIAPILRCRNLGAMRRLTPRVSRTSEAWSRIPARLTGARTSGEYAETHERPVFTFPPLRSVVSLGLSRGLTARKRSIFLSESCAVENILF